MRKLLITIGVVFSINAQAQTPTQPSFSPSVFQGQVQTPSLNATGVVAVYINAIPFITQSSSTSVPSLSIGRGTGLSLPAGSNWATLVGSFAGGILNGSSPYVSALGGYACGQLGTGTNDVCVGDRAGGNWQNDISSTAVGSQAQQYWEYSGAAQNSAGGALSMYAGGGQQNTAWGFAALEGNSGTITVTGTAGATGSVSLVFTYNSYNSPSTVGPVTISNGETAATLCAAIATAINANGGVLYGALGGVSQSCNGSVLSLVFPGSSTQGPYTTTVAPTVTGAAPVTVTYGAGSNGSGNVAIGSRALQGLQMNTASVNNIALGNSTCPNLIGGYGNLCFGNATGTNISSGYYNILIGTNTAGTTLTTGNNDILICSGGTACDVPSSSTSNAFYLFGNSSTAALSITGMNAPTTEAVTAHGAWTFSNLQAGTASTYACFTSGGILISSATAC